MEPSSSSLFLGLRSLIYPSVNLAEDRELWVSILNQEPYFDEPYYIGFDVGGYEIGLHPQEDASSGPETYVGVSNLEKSIEVLLQSGASIFSDIADVGGGVRLAVVRLPNGHLFGVIDNPHFKPKELLN